MIPHGHNIPVYDPMAMRVVYDIVGKGEGGGRESLISKREFVADILDYFASSVFGGGG